MQAWRQGRLDLADHFFVSFKSSIEDEDVQSTTKAIDLCYEIGVHQLQGIQYELSCKWLKRAHDMIETIGEADMVTDVDLSELGLNTAHAYGMSIVQTP